MGKIGYELHKPFKEVTRPSNSIAQLNSSRRTVLKPRTWAVVIILVVFAAAVSVVYSFGAPPSRPSS